MSFTPAQTRMLFTTDCYNVRWDKYWHIKPCDFVMQRLEKEEHIFGTPRLTEAWRNAVIANPLAYLKHRLTFMQTFLTKEILVLPTADLEKPEWRIHTQNPFFMAMIACITRCCRHGCSVWACGSRLRSRSAPSPGRGARRPPAPSRSA